jgi:hypothetical protein
MFVAIKPLLIGGRDDLSIDDERGRGIVANGASQAEDNHGSRAPPGAHHCRRAGARLFTMVALIITSWPAFAGRRLNQAANAIG